ncbi:MAG: hydrogenase 4 subunit F [Symbiobacteriia bacterium]
MNYLGTALIVLPALTGLTAYLLPEPRSQGLASILGSLLTFVAAMVVAARVFTGGGAFFEWGTALRVDALSAYLIVLTGLLTTLAALYTPAYLGTEVRHGAVPARRLRAYYLWFHVFVGTMFWALTANNVGMMWAAVEATTLASTFAVGFYRKPHSLEAAWKYMIICSVGLAFALLGTAVTYAAVLKATGADAGSLVWTDLAGIAPHLDPRLMKLAFGLVLVGYGTKAGLAPMHTWLPDAHSQAPSPVSATLSGVLLGVAFYAILRFFVLVNSALGAGYAGHLLLAFGLLSMAVAVPFTVVQKDLKRLLAYSSIEHIGIIAVGIGLGGPLGVFGALYHLFFHGIGKGLMFFSAGEITQAYHTRNIRRIRGVLKVAPVAGIALVAGMMAITGTPPFALFISEFSVAGAAFGSGLTWVGVLFLLMVAIIFGAFLYHIGPMAFGRPVGSIGSRLTTANRAGNFVMVFCLVLLLVGGLFVPAGVRDILTQVSRVLGVG